jgi:hypothetical protein
MNTLTLLCVLLLGLGIFSLAARLDYRRERSREEDVE